MSDSAASSIEVFEQVLRELSPQAFNALVGHRVRDLTSFLALNAESLSGTSRAVRDEIRRLQASTGSQTKSARAQRPTGSGADQSLAEPAEQSPEPASLDVVESGVPGQETRPATVWLGDPPEWSALRSTVLDVLGVGDGIRDRAWAETRREQLSCLGLAETDWRRLLSAGFSREDHCTCLLAWTVGYLLRLGLSSEGFATVLAFIRAVIDGLGAGATGTRPYASDNVVISTREVAELGELRLDSFDIPSDIVDRVLRVGIERWADLAEVSERIAFAGSEVDIGAFLCVSDLWWLRDYLDATRRAISPLHIGGEDGFTSTIETLLDIATRQPTDRTVFLGRMGLLHGRAWTLQELGDRLGLSRERVRQIENKVRGRLEHPRHRKRLDALRIAVTQVLRTNGGIATYDEMARGLQEVLRWGKMPPAHAVGRLLHSFGICECDRADELAIDPFSRCLNCRVIRGAARSILRDRNLEMGLGEMAAMLEQACSGARHCHAQERIPHFSLGYVRHLVRSHDGFFVDDNKAYSRDTWRLRNGSRVQMVENVLRDAAKPMHFREVYGQLRSLLPDDEQLTPNSVHAALSGLESVLLWDRGTFVYAEAVAIPKALVKRIEVWLIDKLSGGVPFVMVAGAFEEFQDECAARGVTSETALYTCLRRSGDSRLLYPRYPQVYLADTFESRIPALVAVEQYIRDAGRVVPMTELAEYALSDLCLKDFQFQQCLAQTSGIIRTGTGAFIDSSLLQIDPARLERLKSEVLRMLDREGHISVTRVFDEKTVTCRMMGVDGPEMLFSLLRECDFEELDLGAYPQISHARRGRRSGAGRGVLAEVVSYIRQRCAPVSFEELDERYVDGLGYSEQSVHAAARADGVLRYGQGSVVHTDTLAWSDEKQRLLERAALSELRRTRERGWVHGLVSQMVERSELPDLPGHVAWTQTLVCELLVLHKRFSILGNARNAFVSVPNEDGIESLDDVAARILNLELGGAANLEALGDRLRQLGVIRRILTSAMLREGSRVAATGHLVMLRELSDRAE